MAEECEGCGRELEEDEKLTDEGLCDDCDGFYFRCLSCDQMKHMDELNEDGDCNECVEENEDEDQDEEDE